jgi:RNA polymerase sigma-70 factor (ECF subfamily)
MSADRLQDAEEALTVSLAQRGDESAFRRIVDLYDRRLLYFVRRMLGETADAPAVVQTIWLQVHRGLRRLESPRAFRVWIYRIAHAAVVDELRRKPPSVTSLDEIPETVSLQDESDEARFDNAELVHAALGDLSLVHRQVLVLRFLEEMSIEEIAEVVQQPPGTVKSRLHYAKSALRSRIEELES